ncbi:cypmaclein isoform X2 [Elaeis guineensis]|uniref:Gibberellin-regulated protein 8 isoform X2 n=1 Tax=Elaeis guineensis var. tenera TaxID=51953 RepID=A0A6I9S0F9_ELAGV|nr:gibberellin-regulated protein 8 isoform X2 [Elaeis guineensis]
MTWIGGSPSDPFWDLSLPASFYVFTSDVMTNGRSLLQAPKPAINCGAACEVRCSKSWKPKMCKKMCGVCCNKCSCVPPGTSAETRAMCPCYANMRNPKGQLKCP